MSNDARAHRGVVTAVNDGFIYVWNRQTDTKELRFAQQPGMKPGSKVEFEWDQNLGWNDVQTGRIRLSDFQIESTILQYTTKDGVDKWTARTEVIFAPPDSAYFQELQAEVSLLKGVAFSHEFGLVGLFSDKVAYQTGVVYDLGITRLPVERSEVVNALHTVFCVVAPGAQQSNRTRVTPLRNSQKEERLLNRAPWLQPPQQALSEEEPPPQDPPSAPPNTHVAVAAAAASASHVSEPVPGYADDYSEAPVDDLFAEPTEVRWYQGIVFAKTHFVSIYVLNQGFKAHAFINAGPGGFDPEVGTWLFFQIARQDEPIEDMDNAVYLAVDAQPIHPPPMPSAPAAFTTFVHGQVQLRRHNPHVDGSYEGRNEVLGVVRVPGTQDIVYAMNRDVEYVFTAAIVYDQVQSKWWAAAIAGDGRYKFLQGLPPPLDDLGQVFQESPPLNLSGPTPGPTATGAPPRGQSYAHAASRTVPPRGAEPLRSEPPAQPRSQPAAAVIERAPSTTDFRPPERWHFRVDRDKVFDLLGIAVDSKRETNSRIFYTRMGLVEVPAQCSHTTWVRMDATLVNGRPTNITRLRQLPPPMSTRLIQQRSIMLAGYVRRHSDGHFVNDYLGRVHDPRRLLDADSTTNVFAVELELEDRYAPNGVPDYRFLVVKNHTRLVNMQQPLVIPLELSAHPVEWGVSWLGDQGNIRRYSAELQHRYGHTYAPEEDESTPGSEDTSPILELSDSQPIPLPILDGGDSQAPIIDFGVSQPSVDAQTPSTSAAPSVQNSALPTIDPIEYTYINDREQMTTCDAIFVVKKPTYALLYTKEYGLVIMNPAAMPNFNQESFDRWCALGRWWQAQFLPVQGFDANRHAFERICSGGQPLTTQCVPTKVEGDFVPDATLQTIPHSLNDDAGLSLKIFATCDFDEEQMDRVEDGQILVPFALGIAVIDRALLDHLGLLGQSVELWLQYIPEEHECHWRVLGTDEYLAGPFRVQAAADYEVLSEPDPQRVTQTLQYLLYGTEETESDEDGYEADDSSEVYVDTEVECVVDGSAPRRWEEPPADTDSSFMPFGEDVAGGSAETVDDAEQRFVVPDRTARAFSGEEVPIAGNSFLDEDSSSRAPTDPDRSPSGFTNGSDDGPSSRFSFPRLPSRTISAPMNRLVSRANNESVAESDSDTAQNAARQQHDNTTARQLIPDDLFAVRSDAWQQPSDAAQKGAAGPSWQLADAGIAAPYSAAPTQRTDVNLMDDPIADEVAAPSQIASDLLSFDLMDNGSAAPRGSSASQVPSGTFAFSNTTFGSAATPSVAAASQAATEQPYFIDWHALSSPERNALQRDIAAATGTNRELMEEIGRSNYQPAASAEDVVSEDMPIDTAPHDGMAMLADDIEAMKIRETHQLKNAVNRDFRRKTLRDMQQEQQTLRQIESRRASSRASSRASTAMGNAIRLPPLGDMFAQPAVNDSTEDETGLEGSTPPLSTSSHQPLPIRPEQPAAARHEPFGGQAQPRAGSMAKFDVPASAPSRPPARSSNRVRNEPLRNVGPAPPTGHNAANTATAANLNDATSSGMQRSDR